MDNFLILFFALGIALGAGRWADLTFWTDAATGLCTQGSVWLRYAALAAVVLLGVVIGRRHNARPERLRKRLPLAGVLAAIAAVLLCVAAVWLLLFESVGLAAAARALLEAVCAVWLVRLALAWLNKKDGWHAPTRGMVPAVLGTALFYWCVLARFMENSSSWHRVAETAMVWQYLAALMFLTALARALYLPDAADGRALCGGGLCAFALCLCWQLPQTAADIAAAVLAGAAVSSGVYFGLALCFVGALGGVCAAVCLRRDG